MQKLEAELSALTARAALLTAKRATAHGAFDRAVAARDAHMLQGNLDDEKIGTKLQAAVDNAASALVGFDNVIAAQAASIAEAEEKLAVERLAVARKAASDDLTAKTDTIERQIGPWLEATRALAASTTAVGDDVNFEVGQVGAYLRNAAGEVEMATAMAIPALRASVAAIVAGHLPIPRDPEMVTPVRAAAPPTVSVWTTKAITWQEDGYTKIVDLDQQAALPVALADKAIRLAAAVAAGDRRFGVSSSWRKSQGYGPPASENCVNLDATEPANAEESSRPAEQRIAQSSLQQQVPPGFQPLDRGPGFVIKTAPGNPTPGEGEAA